MFQINDAYGNSDEYNLHGIEREEYASVEREIMPPNSTKYDLQEIDGSCMEERQERILDARTPHTVSDQKGSEVNSHVDLCCFSLDTNSLDCSKHEHEKFR